MKQFNAPICLLVAAAITAFFLSCNFSSPALFRKVDSGKSGIHFSNTITENDSINPIDIEYLYNGNGVGIGDFNNDGLMDIYFTASMLSNKLYLNKGNLEFMDVTDEANVTGKGEWFNAVSVVDINNDGWDDIYLSATIHKSGEQRKNLLYINQGPDKNKIPVFKEMAEEYGLADTGFSVHAAFFDYDNDGDLDMYLMNTKVARRDAVRFTTNRDTSHIDFDRLFRNDWNDSLKHPFFTDVSAQAGVQHHGYGLGIAIADINKDGWKDIYVSNDYYSNDELYINNKNGTFTEKAREYFKHTSQNAMGNDIADINNDGLADIITLDMDPESNFRKKKNMGGNNYTIYLNMINQNYVLQYARNTLQLNMGNRVNAENAVGDPVFAETGFYSGIAETDWSWSSLAIDLDNDGYRDLVVTNGYPKDITDHDFSAFRNKTFNIATKQQLSEEMPQIKVPNYIFKNLGNLKFQDFTAQWGMTEPSFSNGAAYADFDNDGDLDYVINNINEEATLYENTLNRPGIVKGNYLQIEFEGNPQNRNGIGAWAEIYYDSTKMQVYENSPYRGYLSTVDDKAFFGLGKTSVIDSLVIRWPDHRKQTLLKIPVNQVLKVNIKNATLPDEWEMPVKVANTYFTDITSSTGIDYVHRETDYIDFNTERLLPHKLSQYGPALTAGDVDGNGTDDIYIGGNAGFPGRFFLQQPDGKFITKELPLPAGANPTKKEQMGLLLFDADNDGDLDLYCASGSNEFSANSDSYQDVIYINDGKGNFITDSSALPVNHTSKSCVKAADIDNDGDLDLFIGGRVLPGSYPVPVSSFIYRNDSKDGKIIFTDITDAVAGSLKDIGLVCDALFTDFNNDGWADLILAGEWMPVTFLKNNKGRFENITKSSGIGNEKGWWSSIAAGDFDNDGDMDYIIGNLGENSFYRASDKYPVRIHAKDFDNNKSLDAIPTLYLKDQEGNKKEYTAQNRDDIVEQLPIVRKKFPTYKSFGEATFNDIFTKEQMDGALTLEANNFSSCLLKNNGNEKFELIQLPAMAQLAPLYGMITDDFNNDGNLDVAICGNDFGTEVTNGRYDAMNGLVLLGDGKGNFISKSITESGLFIPGDARALIKLKGANGNYLLASSQNRGPLKVFNNNSGQKIIPLYPGDRTIQITLPDGRSRKEEVLYGSSFLSQSSLFISISPLVKSVAITNIKGEKRIVQ